MTRPHAHTPENVAFIRARASTMSDAEIGREMGWPSWKVMRVRHQNGIAPRDDYAFWTDDVVEKARQLYLVQGLTSAEVGREIGCDQSTVRRKAHRLGWVRDPAFRAKNQYRAQATRAQTVRRKAKPEPEKTQAPVRTDYSIARRDFSRAQPRFLNTPRQDLSIGDRILAELAARPLSTMTLSTVLGEKEAIVGQALSVLRYEAKVAASDGANIRQTVWSVAA